MPPDPPSPFIAALFAMAMAAPLALAMAMTALSWREKLAPFAPWAALPALLTALFVPIGTEIEIPWLVLGTRLGLDHTGQTFLFFTALLWLVSGVFGVTYLARDKYRGRFFAFYLLAMGGNIGLILAMDVASFYAFYALMSFSSYGLVAHNRDAESLRAGRIYIYLVVTGEVMLVAAFMMIATAAGSITLPMQAASSTALALALLGFGIKAGLLPLHVWLPLAHPVAPTPASAVLSGAMIKAGLIGWLRFLPLGETGHAEWGNLMAALGLAAAFYGVLAGLTQRNPKTVLAYSSISQMGIMTLGIGIGLAAPGNWGIAGPAVLLYAMHHALAKGALFLGVGVAGATGRVARRWVALGLTLPALSMAGAPATSGAIVKAALEPAFQGLTLWADWLPLLFSATAVGTTLLMARYLFLVWPRETGKGRLTIGLWLPWAILVAAAALTLSAWPASAELARASLSWEKTRASLWPVVAGLAISGSAWWMTRHRAKPFGQIPAGDLAVLLEHAGARMRKLWSAAAAAESLAKRTHAIQKGGEFILAWVTASTSPIRSERNLQRWPVACLTFLLLAPIFYLLLAAIGRFKIWAEGGF